MNVVQSARDVNSCLSRHNKHLESYNIMDVPSKFLEVADFVNFTAATPVPIKRLSGKGKNVP